MSYAVKLAAKFMTNPGKKHWEYVVYMVGFLRHSAGFKIVYTYKEEISMASSGS
jgi:hypothetical protein